MPILTECERCLFLFATINRNLSNARARSRLVWLSEVGNLGIVTMVGSAWRSPYSAVTALLTATTIFSEYGGGIPIWLSRTVLSTAIITQGYRFRDRPSIFLDQSQAHSIHPWALLRFAYNSNSSRIAVFPLVVRSLADCVLSWYDGSTFKMAWFFNKLQLLSKK